MALTDLLRGVRSAALGLAVVAGGGCGGEEKTCPTEKFNYIWNVANCGQGNAIEGYCLPNLVRNFSYEDLNQECDTCATNGLQARFDSYQCALSFEPNLYVRKGENGKICLQDNLHLLTNQPFDRDVCEDFEQGKQWYQECFVDRNEAAGC